jgi:hypothetical protein
MAKELRRMRQVYLQRFEYMGPVGEADFEQTWCEALQLNRKGWSVCEQLSQRDAAFIGYRERGGA